MKKDVDFIYMDAVLQEWLMEKLIKDSPKSDGAKELLSGIYDLRNGTITSLMLST